MLPMSTHKRPSQRELRDLRTAKLRAEMDVEIAAGRLATRQMTSRELDEFDARRDANVERKRY